MVQALLMDAAFKAKDIPTNYHEQGFFAVQHLAWSSTGMRFTQAVYDRCVLACQHYLRTQEEYQAIERRIFANQRAATGDLILRCPSFSPT